MRQKLLFLLVALAAMAAWATPDYENVMIDVYRYDLTLNDNGQARAILKGFDAGYTYLTLVKVPGYVEYNGYKFRVDEIARNAFMNNTNITRIYISYGVNQIDAQAFRGCSKVSSLWLPSSLESIGSGAFKDCSLLRHVRFAGDVAPYISDNTFEGTYDPKDCNTATWQGAAALRADAKWAAAFGKNITLKGSSAYDFKTGGLCYAIRDGIPYSDAAYCVLVGGAPDDGVVTLARQLDAGEDINAPGTYPLHAVADSAFCDDPDVVSLDASSTLVRYTGEFSFSGCTNLTSVDMAVDTIGPYTFYGCSNLTSVTMHNGDGGKKAVVHIGDFAFGETGITSVEVPRSVRSMGYSPFHICPNLTSIAVESGNAYYSAYEGCLYAHNKTWLIQVPGAWPHSNTRGYFAPNLQYVEQHAANGNHTIVTLALPYGVKSMSGLAFGYCSKMVNVRIPSSMESISSYAFSGSPIENIYLNCADPSSMSHFIPSESVSSIKLYVPYEGYRAYANSSYWRWYDLQTGDLDHTDVWDYKDDNNCCWTVIDNTSHNNFEGEARDGNVRLVRGVNKMVIPSSVEVVEGKDYDPVEIGRSAFEGLTAPTSTTVTQGQYVERIKERAFYGSSINRFTFTRVEEIGDSAFMNTQSLGVDLELPQLKRLSICAFSNSRVNSFTTGSAFTDIDIAAFMDATSLTTVDMGASTGLTIIDQSAFRNCTALTSCTLPSSVRILSDRCFLNCDLSTKFNFPVSLTTIRYEALKNTKLTDIELPYGITTLEEEALSCLAQRIVLPATITTVHSKFDQKAYMNLTELVLNKVEPLRFSDGDNVRFNTYGYPRGTLYVPVGTVNDYRSTTTWTLYSGDKIISEGAYDFTDPNDGLKYTVTVPPSQAASGECQMVYNPKVINVPTMIIAGDDKYDQYGRPFVCTSVGNYCFKGSTSIISVYFSSTLKTIGFGAFQNSSLANCIESLSGGSSSGYIPRTVSTIGGYAFNGCAGLRELFLPHIDRVDQLIVGPHFFGGNANGFKVWVDYRRLGDFVTVNTWDVDKVYPHLLLDSEWQSFSCVKDINFSNTRVEAYVASHYDKSMNEVSLENVLKLPAETGAAIHGDADGTYYRLDYATNAMASSKMEAVTTGSQTVTSNNALSYFRLDADYPSFTKVTGSDTFYRGYAYLKLNTSLVGSGTTEVGTDLNGMGGPAQGDVNGDGFVNGADVTALYSFLLDGIVPLGEPDVNADGVVNGADITALYTILLEQ